MTLVTSVIAVTAVLRHLGISRGTEASAYWLVQVADDLD